MKYIVNFRDPRRWNFITVGQANSSALLSGHKSERSRPSHPALSRKERSNEDSQHV